MNSSEFRKKYLEKLHTKELPMRSIYADFQAKLNRDYPESDRFPICPRSQKSFYVNIV